MYRYKLRVSSYGSGRLLSEGAVDNALEFAALHAVYAEPSNEQAGIGTTFVRY